jgi:hypothetical protein
MAVAGLGCGLPTTAEDRRRLRDLRRRGILAPMLADGDGALGFRAALSEVFPDTRAQRCWVPRNHPRDRWQSVNAPRIAVLVRAGPRFDTWVMIERGPAEIHRRATQPGTPSTTLDHSSRTTEKTCDPERT